MSPVRSQEETHTCCDPLWLFSNIYFATQRHILAASLQMEEMHFAVPSTVNRWLIDGKISQCSGIERESEQYVCLLLEASHHESKFWGNGWKRWKSVKCGKSEDAGGLLGVTWFKEIMKKEKLSLHFAMPCHSLWHHLLGTTFLLQKANDPDITPNCKNYLRNKSADCLHSEWISALLSCHGSSLTL